MLEKKEASPFQKTLEAVDQLSLEEKELLFEISYRRFVEQRRAHLAQEIAEARAAYHSGAVQRGSVAALLAELAE
ncbi:MAG: hypothetical protein JXA21_15385 [Anaerolineae bacterium]|nr:hypothetical protein [Anaerolineae bacterium]